MRLTEAKLKELILEALEDESPLEGMIKSGQWPMINQALASTVEVGMPLKELPWELLPIDTMADEDLMDLAQYLLDNRFVPRSDWISYSAEYLMQTGLLGMKKAQHPMNKGKSKWRQWVQEEVAKVLGIEQ